jgi:hypothetical protein
MCHADVYNGRVALWALGMRSAFASECGQQGVHGPHVKVMRIRMGDVLLRMCAQRPGHAVAATRPGGTVSIECSCGWARDGFMARMLRECTVCGSRVRFPGSEGALAVVDCHVRGHAYGAVLGATPALSAGIRWPTVISE